MEVEDQCQPQLKDSSTSQIAQCTVNPELESQECLSHAKVADSNGDYYHFSIRENPYPTENAKDKSIIQDLVDQEFFDHLPPGYRFNPTDVELILHYLEPKTQNKQLPRNQIRHVNLYQYSPDEIIARYKELTEREWYFFTPRDRKYRNGNRPNRAAGTGYWKATGADKPIIHNGNEIGFRKALVFYEGKPPKGEKTSWIMHEYRVKEGGPKKKRSEIDMRLDDYILCRIYKKIDKIFKTRQRGEIQNHDIPDEEDITVSKNENDASCSVGYKNEHIYGDHEDHLQHSHSVPPSTHAIHGFHSQPQPGATNKRLRPIHFAPAPSFAPLVYPPENNMSGYLKDENSWSLLENQLGMKAHDQLSEFDFPDMKYDIALPELDNILISMYPPVDDLSMPTLDNSSLPKRD